MISLLPRIPGMERLMSGTNDNKPFLKPMRRIGFAASHPHKLEQDIPKPSHAELKC